MIHSELKKGSFHFILTRNKEFNFELNGCFSSWIFLLKLDSLKLQYSRTINTIYPADEKALKRLPYLIANDLEEDYWSDCKVNKGQVNFITTLPFGGYKQYNPLRGFLNSVLDGGDIWIESDEKGKIQLRYSVRFKWRLGVALVLSIWLAKSRLYLESYEWLIGLLLPLVIYGIFFCLAIQVLKGIMEDALKNRYR